jgi:hypothetical protein
MSCANFSSGRAPQSVRPLVETIVVLLDLSGRYHRPIPMPVAWPFGGIWALVGTMAGRAAMAQACHSQATPHVAREDCPLLTRNS